MDGGPRSDAQQQQKEEVIMGRGFSVLHLVMPGYLYRIDSIIYSVVLQ